MHNSHNGNQAPSYYYQYDFVSPEPIYALIKEELKSYFDTGAVDDALFAKYTDVCLKKLKKGVLKIEQALLHIQGHQSRLPDDFDSVREAWACEWHDFSTRLGSARYDQIVNGCTSTRIDQSFSSESGNNQSTNCDVCSSCTFPDIIQAVYKTTKEVIFQTRRTHLLKPGNMSVRNHMGPHCMNLNSQSSDTFDIRDNKFVVNYPQGVVHLVYYSKSYDDAGFQLIPDEVRTQEYIEYYIKFKVFEQLYNQATDESARQLEGKLARAEKDQFEKLILAETELKKQSAYEKHQAAKRTRTRNSIYEIR